MKIRIPLMIQDSTTSLRYNLNKNVEGFDPEEEFFLDGPISKQIAVLDFSPETGQLVEGAKFAKPPPPSVRGWYEDETGKNLYFAEGKELTSPAFLQVNVFATVLKTIYMFEKKDTLGRPLTWANGSPQLLIVPRAGLLKNAFYQRDSNSLQFFMFPSDENPAQTIYTCLYRDIVSHETGHAIVDGIAPDLYNAQNPEALAIHESIADLTALLMAISSHNLRKIVLKNTNGHIKDSTDFSTIAEKWRTKFKTEGRPLRNLLNEKNLNPKSKEFVKSTKCHHLSEVLSGALYNVLIKIHEDLKEELAPNYSHKKDPLFSASGKALRIGAERFKQMIFRALDYLPPGDVSFADYGRAIIAADSVCYPEDARAKKIRAWIRSEFFNRNITSDKDALEVQTFFEHDALRGIDVSRLHESDWAAYDFANKPETRRLLCIPPDIPFEILPRFAVRKKPLSDLAENQEESHECIFKVAWDHIENNPIRSYHSKKRRVRVGTTLVLYWETGLALALLTSAPPDETNTESRYFNKEQQSIVAEEHKRLEKSRTKFINGLVGDGLLKFNQHSVDPKGRPLLSSIQAEDYNGIMRIKGSGRMLHIIGEEEG